MRFRYQSDKKVRYIYKKEKKNCSFFYNSSLSEIEGLKIPDVLENVRHSYHLYPLRINFKKFGLNKVDLF